MQNYNLKKSIRLIVIAFAGAMIPMLSYAGPYFYWWHMDLNISKSQCVNRTQPAIASEIVVDKIDKGANGSTAWNSNSSIVVYCVSRGSGKSNTVIFVSGFKNQQTKETMMQIRDAMKSGIFE